MNSGLKNAIVVAFCFAWPVGLQFANNPTTFQVYGITAISGLVYFGIRAGLGYIPIGTFSVAPTVVMAICGVMGAIGMEKYVPLLNNHPQYVGISLALANILIVFGTALIVLIRVGNNTIGSMSALGILFMSFGVYLVTLK
jgi:hypothetical protein